MTVPLSGRSAKRCYEWAEAHKADTSLAEAYLDAADVLGTLQDFEAEEERGGAGPSRIASRLIDSAFDLRDTIGREILKRIRKGRA